MNSENGWCGDSVEWTPTPWSSGTAHAVDNYAAPRDIIAELHAVVEEVTGKPVTRPSRRIGFLP
jgi:hypothetical protein